MPIKAVLKKDTFVAKEGRCYHFEFAGVSHIIYANKVTNNEIEGAYIKVQGKSMHTCKYLNISKYDNVRSCTYSEERDILASMKAGRYVQVKDEVIDNFQIF